MVFDYSLYPGKTRKQVNYEEKQIEPKITIITPYYNGNKYIDETINSVLNQTFVEWEWLIVNDGSTNQESLEKLESIKHIDPRIKVINKENGGLAETRDYGAKNASKTSKYLFFLDDDDVIEKTLKDPDFIIHLATELKKERQEKLMAQRKVENLEAIITIDTPYTNFGKKVAVSSDAITIG